MDKLSLKTPAEIKIMAEGGHKLHGIKLELAGMVKVGVRASEIEKKAVELIDKSGGVASFMQVPDYHWATCINVNAGIVHGIPTSDVIFRSGDVVSIDVGLIYKGFNTDTSITVGVDLDASGDKFIVAGRSALQNAISQAKIGNCISDISRAIGTTIEKAGFSPIRDLVGHGVGRSLHENPAIPCFVSPGQKEKGLKIMPGLVIAIEVMYALGDPSVVRGADGWTISTRDGKISGLFEETVAVTPNGPLVLT